MCLIVKPNAKISIADKDIKVFVVRRKYMYGTILSPVYSYYRWKIGEVHSTNLQQNPRKVVRSRSKEELWIENGFHSLKNKKPIKYLLNSMFVGLESVIFLAIIPKGSKYWKGRFGGAISYCSESLKLIKEVKP